MSLERTEFGRPVAVVTGAARGIGRSISVTLASEGYDLVLVDLDEPYETSEEVEDAGGRAVSVVGDVALVDTALRALSACLEGFGRVDGLVNNAGISCIRRAEETSLEDWERVLAVNLTGPFLMCREVGREMLRRGNGSIVNIASVAGILGISERVAYNASKHGLVGLTRTLAAEWGGRGVRVNAVCPGWVKTGMDERDQLTAGYTDADIESRVPMGRFARPEDVAQAVAFLLDPARSSFINGVCLPVDGGWHSDGSWDSLRLRSRRP